MPWTSETLSTVVTVTVVEQVPVCGAASSFAAVSWTTYEPGGTPAATASVALAVPRRPSAGAKPVRAIVPAAGAGGPS